MKYLCLSSVTSTRENRWELKATSRVSLTVLKEREHLHLESGLADRAGWRRRLADSDERLKLGQTLVRTWTIMMSKQALGVLLKTGLPPTSLVGRRRVTSEGDLNCEGPQRTARVAARVVTIRPPKKLEAARQQRPDYE